MVQELGYIDIGGVKGGGGLGREVCVLYRADLAKNLLCQNSVLFQRHRYCEAHQ